MLKWKETTKHRVQHDSATPDINLQRRVVPLGQHFGGRVARTAARCRQLLTGLIEVAESEVYKFDGLVFPNQYILRFQISMGDAQLMQILYRIDKLLKIFASLFLGQSTPTK